MAQVPPRNAVALALRKAAKGAKCDRDAQYLSQLADEIESEGDTAHLPQ